MIHPFDDEFFMKSALAEAEQAFQEGEIPVGAVVVCQNKIIARAYNQTETLSDVTAHAEMLAITSATGWLGGKYLTGCTLYVTLEPCVMCAGALSWAQIDRIVWGASDSKKGFLKFAPDTLHPKTLTSGGLLENECAALLKLFFESRR
jgi:tRNA(adenine34) deaminase